MRTIVALLTALSCGMDLARAQDYSTQLLWGDAHVHSNRSLDSYFWDNRLGDADSVYRFAKGQIVNNPYTGEPRRLNVPLDFMAVTDHAEFLGFAVEDARIAELVIAASDTKKAILHGATGRNLEFLLRNLSLEGALIAKATSAGARSPSWDYLTAAADRHNDPGRFTALIGWEWTGRMDKAAYHRVVLSNTDGAQARRFLPYSATAAKNPEMLWSFLDRAKAQTGADFVAIPHNSNLSEGRMFAPLKFDGTALTAQAAQKRAQWETVAEVTQIKGTSETAPALSPLDEFASFEFYRRNRTPPPTRADFVRGALLTGIEQEARIGVNPFKLGMIGSTDSHSGIPSAEEDNFTGHFAYDADLANKSFELEDGSSGWNVSASGLAAVWAKTNTRADIIAAMRRREVYGTSGPRIAVRFFGGYGFQPADAQATDVAAVGYAGGVPMGGDLVRAADSAPPRFLIRAVKDPRAGNLDRIQIVKGWVGAGGAAQEKIFNVAWSDGRALNADGSLPPVGDTVNRSNATYTNSIGAADLSVVWTDPEFDPAARAFYYVRVLQIPTPRHSLYDAVKLGIPPQADLPTAIQERAFSSPIWYTP